MDPIIDPPYNVFSDRITTQILLTLATLRRCVGESGCNDDPALAVP